MKTTSSALQILLDVLGEADTVRLIEALRGTRWNVPSSGRFADGHPIVECIGREKADALCQYTAGETGFRVPMDQGTVDRLIYEAEQAGASQNELAIRFRKDLRTIQIAIGRHRRHAGRMRMATAQTELFS